MASRSLGFFPMGLDESHFVQGWKMLKIVGGTPAFSFVCSMGRRPTSIEPKILGVPPREVDLRVSDVNRDPRRFFGVIIFCPSFTVRPYSKLKTEVNSP